ncbi:TIGR02444 family protein [Veronia nyctiphanis]|uniref:TIGR02444 family protein n=1 Tax=Veronia nyctiphanis TaxID=1278244 RepID=A0A4Q0YTE8_9GAMM|nr:TIGR02444 family protein [Veronia nyctiphanis]RXJ73434.1 TIGR02444 family protein [Veronia nyctiphanis]
MDGTPGGTGNHGSSFPKPMIQQATAEALWQFSLSHYSHHDVKHACLKLQDDYQGNVNLALLLVWLELSEFSLSDSDLYKLKSALSDSETLLRRYRQVRRDLKAELSHSGYQKLLNFELMLEKKQQQDLIAAVNHLPWLTGGHSAVKSYCLQLSASAVHLYPLLTRIS